MKNTCSAVVIWAMFLNVAWSEDAKTNSATLGAPFVVVSGSSQLHSHQIFGSQPGSLLDQVDGHLKRLGGRLVKVNVVAADDAAVESLVKQVHERYAQTLPVITCAVGKLSEPDASLGIDVLIAYKPASAPTVRVEEDMFGRVLHSGSPVYISGQAERGEDSTEAALRTMESLKTTLGALDMSLDDVVQARAFLTPMRSASRIRSALEKFFESRKVPLVIVEWKSNLPIEIEIVASSSVPNAQKSIEYLTPLNMSPSPLYAKVAKLNSPTTIYIGGMYATSAGELPPDKEVKEVFAGLQSALDASGSDLEHLVKATYFCASTGTSTQLNELRPHYYNPVRPPAASKAIVPGVGLPGRYLTLDMIATPK